MWKRSVAVLSATAWLCSSAWGNGPPQVDQAGREGYAAYLQASGHKAYAVATGGVWTWRAEMSSSDAARDTVLEDCAGRTRQRCFLYSVDGRVVLDEPTWWQAWGPYPSSADAGRAATGTRRGERFPDLLLNDAKGRKLRLSDLRGKVVVAHFWGSWCPHCIREMPDLQGLYERLRSHRRVTFMLLPVRESFAQAQAWAKGKKVRMPLYDGGVTVMKDNAFKLADGGLLPDRQVARVFPSTYVLDRHGVVLFSHTGPVASWMDYLPQLLDAAARSGRR